MTQRSQWPDYERAMLGHICMFDRTCQLTAVGAYTQAKHPGRALRAYVSGLLGGTGAAAAGGTGGDRLSLTIMQEPVHAVY
jgi:hypothetical protein